MARRDYVEIDRDDDYLVEDDRPNRSGWWTSLLLIPLFFIFGWMANDIWESNPNTNSFQPGVGGGPAETRIEASPTPYRLFDNEGTTRQDDLPSPATVPSTSPGLAE